MAKSVNVIVAGTSGTGKSTICSIIANALREYGIDTNVHLTDGLVEDDVSDSLDVRASGIAAQDISVSVVETIAITGNCDCSSGCGCD